MDRNLSLMEALRTSKDITMGNKTTLFLLALSLAGMNVAGMLACCVGLLFSLAYGALSAPVAYLLMTSQRVADA